MLIHLSAIEATAGESGKGCSDSSSLAMCSAIEDGGGDWLGNVGWLSMLIHLSATEVTVGGSRNGRSICWDSSSLSMLVHFWLTAISGKMGEELGDGHSASSSLSMFIHFSAT